MKAAHEASGADMVTVAVRRVDISRKTESLLDYIDTSKIFLLPNTAACYTADDAIRTARLGREAGLSNWVKLEVIGDEQTLFPDNEGLLEATRVLVKEGFVVLPYTNDDPVMCRKLAEAGAAAVMPLGAPIGSGLGIQNPEQHPHHQGTGEGAGDRRCRRRHGVGRGDRDGARRRRRADEHRDRRRAGSGRDGAGDEAGGRGRPPGLPRGPHSEEIVRHRQQPPPRRRRVLMPAAWSRLALIALYGAASYAFCSPLFAQPTALGVFDWDQHLFYYGAVLKSVVEYGQMPFWNPVVLRRQRAVAEPADRDCSARCIR